MSPEQIQNSRDLQKFRQVYALQTRLGLHHTTSLELLVASMRTRYNYRGSLSDAIELLEASQDFIVSGENVMFGGAVVYDKSRQLARVA